MGGLVGWGASYLWPRSYRTQAQIFVGLNPYRAFEDAQFLALNKPEYTNVDDYKNWQMSQLSAAIFVDDIIRETLRTLRDDDPYWNGVSANQLSDMLRAEWRTAGIWSLVAEGPDARRTNQAVREWSQTVVKKINKALSDAQEMVGVDEELQAVQRMLLETSLDKENHLGAQKLLQEWLDNTPNLPPGQALQQADRLRLAYLAASLAQFSPAWTELLAAQPGPEASPQDYADWLAGVLAASAEDQQAIEHNMDLLQQEQARLEERYEADNAASLGLSPNLIVKDYEKFRPQVIRPTWLFILLGSITGLLGWFVFTFIMITRRGLSR